MQPVARDTRQLPVPGPWTGWPTAVVATPRRSGAPASSSCIWPGPSSGGFPATVDALIRHPWLLVVEAVTLVALGTGLWLELVESPPLVPRLSRPHRVALAAVSMWAIWVLAYLVGLSHASWYHAFTHHAGTGLSLSADQQLSTGMMWFISGCAFIPVVFWNLIQWLQSEEDPDEELHHLLRVERLRGRTGPGGQTTT